MCGEEYPFFTRVSLDHRPTPTTHNNKNLMKTISIIKLGTVLRSRILGTGRKSATAVLHVLRRSDNMKNPCHSPAGDGRVSLFARFPRQGLRIRRLVLVAMPVLALGFSSLADDDLTYVLAVNGGSGSGSYTAGTVVEIEADPAPAGRQFDQWIGDVGGIEEVTAASTMITMPAGNVTVTANYRPRQYILIVNSGTGGGSHTAGASVNIVADIAPAGLEFDHWIGDVAHVANVTAASTSITMPAADIMVTATYKTPQYELTVNSGTGSGSYAAGSTVNIVASTAPAGQEFDRWTGNVANVANISAISTFMTMPAANATVTATYKARQYTLTVNSGTGSGSYVAGATLNIVAAAAPTGQEFDRWTGDVANVANVNAASTFITMTVADATVTAVYRARQYELIVNGGTGSGIYAAGTVVSIQASPAPAGLEFDQWTGEVESVAHASESFTSITMPTTDVTVTATYRARQLSLTVNSGTGSGNYTAGTTVNIVAEPAPDGHDFDQWTGDVADVANVHSASTFVTMPAADVTVTATYKAQPRSLTVNGGTGSGNYAPGTPVVITAGEAPVGQGFDQWVGDIENVEDVNEASTILTMPAADAAVTATYKARQYVLTVNGGTGSSSYLAGTTVEIEAADAPEGQEFDQWSGDVADVANVHSASTFVTMPAADVTVTASYRLPGGVSGIVPVESLTATGNGGMITTINGIAVADLLLGMTVFQNPASSFEPANADNFDLNLVASADGQPYLDCTFGRPVTTVFVIESGGNDSGFIHAYDAAGNRAGPTIPLTTDSYFRTIYRSGNNQIVAGFAVQLAAPVSTIRILPPTGGSLGIDPVSISGVPLPSARVLWSWDVQAESWRLEWIGANGVLQHATSLESGWSDVPSPAGSPYVVVPEEPLRFFRLRDAGVE